MGPLCIWTPLLVHREAGALLIAHSRPAVTGQSFPTDRGRMRTLSLGPMTPELALSSRHRFLVKSL